MNLFEEILFPAWTQLISEYTSGKRVLKSEKDLEKALAEISKEIIKENNFDAKVRRQRTIRERIVDLEISDAASHLLVQIKLYHDKADWKETRSMINTVESDLKFAKGHEDTYIALIDTIPSTSRQILPFKIDWKTIDLEEKVYAQIYSAINPRTSPQREKKQRALLSNGNQI